METAPKQPIRATAIKAGALSMAHMRLAMTGDAKADSPAMRWGRLVHMAVLDPLALAELPRWDGGRKAGKAWDAFCAEQRGDSDDFLVADELPALNEITRSAVRALSTLPRICCTEKRLDWEDAAYGTATARVDAILAGGGLLEVKTCGKIASESFLRQAYGLHYEMQLGWYAHGLKTHGINGTAWVLAVESKPPYCCAIYRVPDGVIEKGYEAAREIAVKYRVCEACGSFPGPYDDQVLEYALPEWAGGADVNMEGCEDE